MWTLKEQLHPLATAVTAAKRHSGHHRKNFKIPLSSESTNQGQDVE